jgi:uncharacterized membrane protein SpoIIM required for sporulation
MLILEIAAWFFAVAIPIQIISNIVGYFEGLSQDADQRERARIAKLKKKFAEFRPSF